ncbi:MAG: hypothetical protein ACKO3C_06960 [Betaproteobacteria bacterium]
MLEVVHLLGVSLILGNLVLVDLRIFGLGTSLALEDLARLALPLVLLGAGLCALSGLLMFSTQASDLLANRVFTLKMLLLTLAAGNAVWFHLRGSLRRLDRTARWLAFTSLVLWLITLGLGRWIAYV